MRLCRLLEVLFKVVPLRPWQGFFIRRHMERCPACRARLAGREEARRVLFSEADVPDPGSFWPAVRSGLAVPPTASEPSVLRRDLQWRWATAVAMVVLAVALGALIFRGFRVERTVAPRPVEDRFEVDYVRIGDQTADSYIVRSREPRMNLVWAGKKAKGGLS